MLSRKKPSAPNGLNKGKPAVFACFDFYPSAEDGIAQLDEDVVAENAA
jgi:hypothetical protein